MTHSEQWANYLADLPYKKRYHTITAEQFAEFERALVIYLLRGDRFGQAFCEHFEIGSSTPLFYFRSESTCREWIKNNWLVK